MLFGIGQQLLYRIEVDIGLRWHQRVNLQSAADQQAVSSTVTMPLYAPQRLLEFQSNRQVHEFPRASQARHLCVILGQPVFLTVFSTKQRAPQLHGWAVPRTHTTCGIGEFQACNHFPVNLALITIHPEQWNWWERDNAELPGW